MKETNQIQLRLSWEGTEYVCRPDMKTLMMIEERVLLHKLASAIVRGPEEIPATHLIWVIYCLLFNAGARTIDADDVRRATIDGGLDANVMIDVARWIVQEVFGPSPRKEESDAPKT